MIFQKESTRTRVSFNVGFNKMGGNCIELILIQSGLEKGKVMKIFLEHYHNILIF